MSDTSLERFKPEPLVPADSGKQVDIPTEVVTDEEAIEALERMGNVKLPKGMMNDLAKVGVNQAGIGVFKLVRGDSMMNRTRLNLAMNTLLGYIIRGTAAESAKGKKGRPMKPLEMAELAHKLGYLSSKMTESHRLMVDMEQARPGGPHDDEPAHQASFGAGEDIKPATTINAQTVHIHEGVKPPA